MQIGEKSNSIRKLYSGHGAQGHQKTIASLCKIFLGGPGYKNKDLC